MPGEYLPRYWRNLEELKSVDKRRGVLRVFKNIVKKTRD